MQKLNFSLSSRCSNFLTKLFTLLFLLLLFTANGFSQTISKPKPLTAKALGQSNFVMCEVMPGTEVASKAPFTIPFKNAIAWPTEGIKTGCRYIFKSDNDEAGVSIALTDLGNSINALTSYKNAWQASKELWDETPASAIVLQDTGFFSGKDECGLKWHLGKYILDINFKGQFPDVSDQQKKEAGVKLAEIVMDRLKYLWK
jgi:hypothetical protein